ncbi:polyprenol reductase isoform X1 [Acipenser ruthenus]|uniref:polyprenol reductase isoform X1 n=1 Tax=Acipenser ruthenus TaxID=7906 RepID=UPI00145C0460|nr:polyprenol reductase isoform X1 [Acipenser ruthenus]
MEVIDAVWFVLSVCFFLALCVHNFAAKADRFSQSQIYNLFQDLIRYGKTKTNLQRPAFLHAFDVPKRWFIHFYTVSVIWNGLLMVFLLQAVLLGQHFPEWLTGLMRTFSGGYMQLRNGDQLSVLLVQMLLWLHSFRRLLECMFISVFSDGVIHVVQYFFGLSYYILLGLTVLCTSFPIEYKGFSIEELFSQIQWNHLVGIMIFIWASIHQHMCHVILANLRKGDSGKVVNLGHSIPRGDWFELVSCPHYFAELLIYISFSVTFSGCKLTWWLVVLYVLFNQALAAFLCHEFYFKKFKSYPKKRKAFIPFVL